MGLQSRAVPSTFHLSQSSWAFFEKVYNTILLPSVLTGVFASFFFFFWISNENFIENEDGFMFTMMNTKYLNKLQKHQVENLK